jgi:hypothetical protein
MMNMTLKYFWKVSFITFCFCGSFTFFGCSQKQNYPFEFVETKSGLSVYLDGARGKLIYMDETNRIIDYVSLKPNSNEITIIEDNKIQALKNTDRGERSMPGTDYSVKLSTRFYSNRLLYVLELKPFDERARRFANTVSIELLDENGFVLGEIDSTYDWTTTVDSNGKEIGLNTQGSISITLRNYLEIDRWGPKWQDINK